MLETYKGKPRARCDYCKKLIPYEKGHPTFYQWLDGGSLKVLDFCNDRHKSDHLDKMFQLPLFDESLLPLSNTGVNT